MDRRNFCKLAAIGGAVAGIAMVANQEGPRRLVIALQCDDYKSILDHSKLITKQFAEFGIDALVVLLPPSISCRLHQVDRQQGFFGPGSGRFRVFADGLPIECVEWADTSSGLVCRFERENGKFSVPIRRVVEQYSVVTVKSCEDDCPPITTKMNRFMGVEYLA